jgi:hypothetical protein
MTALNITKITPSLNIGTTWCVCVYVGGAGLVTSAWPSPVLGDIDPVFGSSDPVGCLPSRLTGI